MQYAHSVKSAVKNGKAAGMQAALPAGKAQLKKMLRGMNYEDGKKALSPQSGKDKKQDPVKNGEPKPIGDEIGYKEIKGEPFVAAHDDLRPVHYNDVFQGGLGDCYLLAALSAVAKTDPAAIYDMIKTNNDGTYTVRFFLDRMGMTILGKKTEEVTVSGAFPAGKDGMPVYANSGLQGDKYTEDGKQKAELWVMIVEKAWAKLNGSYKKIWGGDSGKAMEAITGKESESFLTEKYGAEEIFTRIEQGIKKGHPVTASTYEGEETQEEKNIPISRKHAYAVIGASGGKIELYNPHGKEHPRPLGADEFKKFFRRVNINEK
ncbi:MAG: hypothetical protein FJ088_01245 [Deltaproteobacteria bacterium]|nr:hypothetical protein [Deltaproteobacteria bacterium]